MKFLSVTPWIVEVPVAEPGVMFSQGQPGSQRSVRQYVFVQVDTDSRLDAYDAFIDTPLDVRQGHLHVPDRPGLGLEMNLDYLRAHAVEGWSG
jgi:L-alanine-DL-glutamate epimerase-like enolase superfamily enzyme